MKRLRDGDQADDQRRFHAGTASRPAEPEASVPLHTGGAVGPEARTAATTRPVMIPSPMPIS